jgi:hypothetical protein
VAALALVFLMSAISQFAGIRLKVNLFLLARCSLGDFVRNTTKKLIGWLIESEKEVINFKSQATFQS